MRVEERLREQTALARLGEMAAVIAHEVKNPLAGVRGAIQVIGGRLPAESKDAAVVKEIVNRIDALNELMKDLLLFARPPQPRPTLVDVAALIRTTADLLSGDPALKGIALHIEGTVPPLRADAELLKIVFQNLLMNGAQAMQGRGAVQVILEPVDGMCRVTVRDSGPGIPADVREKIFTPFFTTKARGTGLGLPTAKRIVEAHGGSIAVHCRRAVERQSRWDCRCYPRTAKRYPSIRRECSCRPRAAARPALEPAPGTILDMRSNRAAVPAHRVYCSGLPRSGPLGVLAPWRRSHRPAARPPRRCRTQSLRGAARPTLQVVFAPGLRAHHRRHRRTAAIAGARRPV